MDLIRDFITFLRESGKSENTIYNYHLAICDYFDWFKGTYDKEPVQLYVQNVRDYLQFCETVKRLAAKTINARVAALIKYNEFLVAAGHQAEVVVNKRMRKKIQQNFASPAEFGEREVNKFRQAVIEGGNKRDYALFMLLAYTGCRVSEALNIEIARDLFLASKELVIHSGKGNKERTVLLSDKVVEAIKEYLKERENHRFAGSPYLFLSNKGGKLSRVTAYQMFAKYSQAAGLERTLTPHDLRHFFCSYALENGFDVHEVANMAGHSNIHTTLLYTNPSRRKMLEKLNRL